jgi:hypothetical protein
VSFDRRARAPVAGRGELQSKLRAPPAAGERCEQAPAPVAGLLDLRPSALCRDGEPDALWTSASASRPVWEGAGDGEGRREGCECQMRERESMEGEGREVEED